MASRRVKKDWGWEEYMADEPEYCGKVLRVDEGWQCSLHMHPVKKETFFVYEGMVFLDIGGSRLSGIPGDSFTIMPETKHRFGSKDGAVLIETSTHHDDADVVRFEPSMRIPEPEKL